MKEHRREQPTRIFIRDPKLYGSARWADKEHLAARTAGEHGAIFLGYGMPEGKSRHSYAITSNTKKHILTIAPTRSGKSVTSMVGRCLDHAGPLVVADPKNGEAMLITARARMKQGRQVRIIDPWGEVTTELGIEAACFNPLDILDPDGDDAIDDAFLIADSLILEHGVKDPHWNNEARALIMGLCLYVKATPTVLLPTPKKSCDLAQVRRLLSLPPTQFREMIAGIYTEDDDGKKSLTQPGMIHSRHEHVRAAAGRILSKSSKEFSSILSTAQANTHFLESPRIQSSLKKSDFKIEDLEQGDTDIYIVLPAGRLWMYARFLRLFINVFITGISRFKTKPNPPVYFVIEEMAALGKLDTVEEAFGLMAGLGIQMHAILQDLSQLTAIYAERWQTFIANSGVIQCFGTRDFFTAEYFSKLCGVTSVENLSLNSAEQRAGLLTDPFYFSSEDSIHMRPLITPDEVMTMPAYAQLLILSNAYPVMCFKTAYFLDQRYRDRAGRPVYDIHPHYRHLPIPRPINFIKAGVGIAPIIGKILDEGTA